ncbi:MAG: hypothetical protein WBV26_24620, partial [Candidatus Sulfotelmatobacter sp.]
LVQHQLPEMGHSDLLVTQTLYRQQCWGRPRGSVRRASGLVQTGDSEAFGPEVGFAEIVIDLLQARFLLADKLGLVSMARIGSRTTASVGDLHGPGVNSMR